MVIFVIIIITNTVKAIKFKGNNKICPHCYHSLKLIKEEKQISTSKISKTKFYGNITEYLISAFCPNCNYKISLKSKNDA